MEDKKEITIVSGEGQKKIPLKITDENSLSKLNGQKWYLEILLQDVNKYIETKQNEIEKDFDSKGIKAAEHDGYAFEKVTKVEKPRKKIGYEGLAFDVIEKVNELKLEQDVVNQFEEVVNNNTKTTVSIKANVLKDLKDISKDIIDLDPIVEEHTTYTGEEVTTDQWVVTELDSIEGNKVDVGNGTIETIPSEDRVEDK